MLGILDVYLLVRHICPLDLIHVFSVVHGGDDFLFLLFFLRLIFQKSEITSLRILSSFILALNTK